MKKILSAFLALIIVLSLSACSSGPSKKDKYEEGIALIESEQYEEAIRVFDEILDYENAAELKNQALNHMFNSLCLDFDFTGAVDFINNNDFTLEDEIAENCCLDAAWFLSDINNLTRKNTEKYMAISTLMDYISESNPEADDASDLFDESIKFNNFLAKADKFLDVGGILIDNYQTINKLFSDNVSLLSGYTDDEALKNLDKINDMIESIKSDPRYVESDSYTIELIAILEETITGSKSLMTATTEDEMYAVAGELDAVLGRYDELLSVVSSGYVKDYNEMKSLRELISLYFY